MPNIPLPKFKNLEIDGIYRLIRKQGDEIKNLRADLFEANKALTRIVELQNSALTALDHIDAKTPNPNKP